MMCDCQVATRRNPVDPAPSISVNARLYKLVSGNEPRGVRTWRFAMGATTGVFAIPDASYETAERVALARARTLDVDHITVLP